MPYAISDVVQRKPTLYFCGLACLICLLAKVSSPIVSAQTELPVQLTAGQKIEGELNGAQTRDYELMLEAGQFVEVAVEQLGINISATLLNPDGKVIFTSDSHRGVRGIERVCAIADATGRYELKVQSVRQQAAPGKYQVKVTELRPVTAQDRERIVGQELFAEGDRYRMNADEPSWAEARELFRQSLEHWKAIGDQNRQAVTLRQISALSGRLRFGEEALDEGEQAAKLYRDLEDRSGEAHSIFTKGDALRVALHEPDRARQCYEEALNICHDIGERLIEGLLRQRLAVLFREHGEYRQAREYAEKSLELSQTTAEPGDELIAAKELCAIYVATGEKQKAFLVYDQMLQHQSRAVDRKTKAELMIEIGRLHQSRGDVPAALNSYNDAMAIFCDIADRDGQANALVEIGWLLNLPGRKQPAIDRLNEALNIFRETGNVRGQATALKFLSSIHSSLGQKQKALDFVAEAVRVLRDLGDKSEEASALLIVSEVYRDLGEWQISLDRNEEALQSFRSINDRIGEAKALSAAGLAHYSLGDTKLALERIHQAIELSKKIGTRGNEAFAQSILAAVYQSRGEREKAFKAYTDALELSRLIGDRHLEINVLHNLGWFYFGQRDYQQAVEHQAQAQEFYRQMGNPVGESSALTALAESYSKLGQSQKGIDLARQSIDLAHGVGELGLEAHALLGLTNIYLDAGRLQQARESIENAIWLNEIVRGNVRNQDLRASYLATAQAYFETYTDLLMKLDKQNPGERHAAEAFESSESRRARSLLELLTKANVDLRQGVNPELATFAAAKPLSLTEVQPELGSDTMLLEYSLGNECSYLWAVTNDSIKVFELAGRQTINKQANEVRRLLSDHRTYEKNIGETPKEWQKRMRLVGQQLPDAINTLSKTVMGEVAPLLGRKRLLIVADGALQYIPFGALSVSSQPLIVEHEIVNLPSASTIAVLRRRELSGRPPAPGSLVVLANPVFKFEKKPDESKQSANNLAVNRANPVRSEMPNDLIRSINETIGLDEWGNLPSLKGAKEEAEAIVKAALGKSPKLAIGFDASLEFAVCGELSKYRIIHFATHGLLNSSHPDLSGVVLSLFDRAGQRQDGFLRLQDIYNLKLSADLVVLSACQTGLGKEVSGEGLIGLTRGFMYAGSPRVVASLWNVGDKPTAELMKRFYAEMLGPKKLRPAAALRAAQISMWRELDESGQKRYQSYDWAGFVLQGEWR